MKIRLGDLTRIRTGKLDANASSEDGEYPFFTCSKEPLKISTYSYDCECVLVAGNGDLNVKYYKGRFDAYQRTYILEAKHPDKLYVPYLYFFMEKYIVELRQLAIGGVIKYIKLQNLTDAQIELPSYKEQQFIVNILSKVVSAIENRKRQLRKLDELVKSQFIEMFTLGNFPMVPIEKLVDRGLKKKKDIAKLYDTIYYIDISSIDNELKQVTGYALYRIDKAPSRAQQVLKKGDILVSTVRPNLQNIAINPYSGDNVVASTGFCVLRCTGCLPEYMWGVMLSDNFTRTMCEEARGVSYPAIRDSNVLQYQMPDAPIELQEQFAAFVRQTDKSRVVIKRAMEETQKLYDSLMQEYFG